MAETRTQGSADQGWDRLLVVASWLAALISFAALAWILSDLLRQGLSQLSWTFLSAEPSDSGRTGGIAPVLLSTLLILMVCLATSVPIAVASGLFLAEFQRQRGGVAPLVRTSLDTLAGVPSIVFGLFGNALFCRVLGLGYSLLAGGLTLACMVLPLLIRSMESAFRAVPQAHRQAGAALGLPQWLTIRDVILPLALPGLMVGLVLSIGRALAETAALLFTSGYVDRLPASLLDSGRALSVHIYDLAMNVSGGAPMAAATALLLLMVVLLLSGGATVLAQLWQRRLLEGEA
ncbi:MAG: phosphate ABC transporter permease PstA [Vulcanococcus sp.]